jgi:hypothetical protein
MIIQSFRPENLHHHLLLNKGCLGFSVVSSHDSQEGYAHCACRSLSAHFGDWRDLPVITRPHISSWALIMLFPPNHASIFKIIPSLVGSVVLLPSATPRIRHTTPRKRDFSCYRSMHTQSATPIRNPANWSAPLELQIDDPLSTPD